MFLVEMMRRLMARQVCPVCGHRQAPRREEGRGVRCEKCGAAIPSKGHGPQSGSKGA